MSATCAVCEQPIRRRDDFVLEGTEAVHKVCVGNVHRSRSRRDAQTILKLQRLVGREREEIESVRRHLREAVEDRTRVTRAAQDQVDGMRERVRDRDSELDRLRGLNRDLAAQIMGARVVEVVTTRAPLPAPAIVAAPSDPPATDKTEERDASEIRFSLLEIDST